MNTPTSCSLRTLPSLSKGSHTSPHAPSIERGARCAHASAGTPNFAGDPQ
jgi:hypothetical protein